MNPTPVESKNPPTVTLGDVQKACIVSLMQASNPRSAVISLSRPKIWRGKRNQMRLWKNGPTAQIVSENPDGTVTVLADAKTVLDWIHANIPAEQHLRLEQP